MSTTVLGQKQVGSYEKYSISVIDMFPLRILNHDCSRVGPYQLFSLSMLQTSLADKKLISTTRKLFMLTVLHQSMHTTCLSLSLIKQNGTKAVLSLIHSFLGLINSSRISVFNFVLTSANEKISTSLHWKIIVSESFEVSYLNPQRSSSK